VKNDSLGKPSKYKAMLVARGLKQREVLDLKKTFAPKTKPGTHKKNVIGFLHTLARNFCKWMLKQHS
jgi:hypothetical protein